jgi:GR25 family glycosyltransferase involved in LPS biosynthesis
MSMEQRKPHVEAKNPLDVLFPLKVCINLDRRPDRWQKVTKRFASHNVGGVVRFPAIDGTMLESPRGWTEEPGAYGCLRSHLAVVENARIAGTDRILIFEDDVVLAPDFAELFPRYANQLPDDWDMVMFGGIHCDPPVPRSDNVCRVSHSLSTFAYALKHTIYDAFIQLNRHGLAAVDDNNAVLQKRFKCYCFMPHLAWVDEDLSDVRDEVRSHWYVSKSLVLWGSEVDDAYSKTAVFIHHRGDSGESRRNLNYILRLYLDKLPGITVQVLETGNRPALDRSALPAGNCRYEFIEGGNSLTDSAVFDTALTRLEAPKQFFLFMESGVLIDVIDLKPNLLMLKQYDFATCFKQIIDLDESDTDRIINNDIRWNHHGKYAPKPKGDLCSSACMFTRRGLQTVGGWTGSDECAVSARVRSLIGIFDSPNGARRLFGGCHDEVY